MGHTPHTWVSLGTRETEAGETNPTDSRERDRQTQGLRQAAPSTQPPVHDAVLVPKCGVGVSLQKLRVHEPLTHLSLSAQFPGEYSEPQRGRITCTRPGDSPGWGLRV